MIIRFRFSPTRPWRYSPSPAPCCRRLHGLAAFGARRSCRAAPAGRRIGAAAAVGPGGAARACARRAAPPVAAAPGAAAAVRRRDQGRQAQRRLLTVWQKDEKVWLELKPEDFGQPFFLSPKIATGHRRARLLRRPDGPYGSTAAADRRVPARAQPGAADLARNVELHRQAGTPEARAVEAGFSPSLLASAAVASQPHPERKSVLVEANTLFLADMLGIGMDLQRTYRQGYAFDRAQLGDHRRARQARRSCVLEVARPLRHRHDRGAAARRAARRAAAVDAAVAARRAQHVPRRCTTRWPRCRTQPMRGAQGRPARRLLRRPAVQDFSDDLARTPRVALRQPLAPREEGSRRRRCPSRSSRSPSGSTAPSP